MAKRKRLFWIILGFKGELLRDTLAVTAKEAKIRCVNSLARDNSEYEWKAIQEWGWRCVRVSLEYND